MFTNPCQVKHITHIDLQYMNSYKTVSGGEMFSKPIVCVRFQRSSSYTLLILKVSGSSTESMDTFSKILLLVLKVYIGSLFTDYNTKSC